MLSKKLIKRWPHSPQLQPRLAQALVRQSNSYHHCTGEHKNRLGYIIKYYKCNKYVKVCLVSKDNDFPRSQPVVVKRRHIQPGAPGSLQQVDGDADDFSICNLMAEDDDYQWDDDEDEEEIDPTPSPSNTIITTIGKKHSCPSSLQGRPAKRQKVEQSTTTIIGGKYAGQKCIILKHLARRVRVQLLDSGRVTCISRGSLRLDEEKTVWHAQPRRSPRIQAMKMMEVSTCRKSLSLAAGNP